MSTIPIELYKALQKAGVPEQEAEDAARSVWDNSHLATQQDFSTVSNKILEVKGEIAAVKGEIAAVKVEVAEVRGEVAEVKVEVAEVKGELKLIKWMLALIVVVMVVPLLKSWLGV